MATTAKGFPYPVGTDRVMDGDDAIKALAEKVDTAVGVAAAGSFTSSVPTALNTPVSTAVTFPAGRFTVAPQVMCSLSGSAVNAFAPLGVTGVSNTGCVVWYSKSSGGLAAVIILWMAIQNP